MIYEPAEDSYLIAQCIPAYVANKTVLDMGTGSGILAKTALDAGAKSVIAVDRNPLVIARWKYPDIPVRESDLFSNVPETFDIIICNPPYLPRDVREDESSAQSTSGGEAGDEYICSFLAQADSHLNPNGIILLVCSSLTPLERIKSELMSRSFSYRPIVESAQFMETIFVWEIQKS